MATAAPKTYPTDQGGRISITDAAEKMYGTGSPQHLKAMEMERRKTAANPYMPGGNPFMQAQDAGAQSVPNPSDMQDGPANPPIAPPPATTVTPMTTRPRTMPNGQTAPMSTGPGAGAGDSSSDVPVRSAAAKVPIICHACGQRGEAPLARIAAGEMCGCGSDDLDLDFTAAAEDDDEDEERETPQWAIDQGRQNHNRYVKKLEDEHGRKQKKGSWETDMPMGMVEDTEAVRQPAKCSNCLQETMVIAEDPAAPMPPCPNCGADLLTPAGATMASKTAGELSEGGFLTTIANMINAARQDKDKIPGWFMKWGKHWLLPEEVKSGYFIHSEGGGSLDMAFGRKLAANTTPDDKPAEHPGWICPSCNFNSRLVDDMEVHLSQNPGHRKSAAAPKWRPDPTAGPGGGEAEEEGREKSQRKDRADTKRRAEDDEAEENYRRDTGGKFAAKVEQITAGILATNPSMPAVTARRVAIETVERYPKMLGSRG